MTFRLKTAAISAAALVMSAHIAQAAPITYEGTATILAPVNNVDNKLALFFADVPTDGDQVSFKAVYDPDTLAFSGTGAGAGFPETNFFTGGLTSIEFTIGSTTLMSVPGAPEEASVLATTADTPQVFIPFFTDGYSITIGSPLGQPRWSANLFFFNGDPDLPNADAPTSLPDPSDFEFAGFGLRVFDDSASAADTNPASFGSPLDSFVEEDDDMGGNNGGGTPIAEPASLTLLGLGLTGLGFARRRRSS